MNSWFVILSGWPLVDELWEAPDETFGVADVFLVTSLREGMALR